MILTYLYFKKQIVFFTKNFLMMIDIFKYIYEQEVFRTYRIRFKSLYIR